MGRLLERMVVLPRTTDALRRGAELDRVGKLRDARVRSERRRNLKHGSGKQESEAQAATHGSAF